MTLSAHSVIVLQGVSGSGKSTYADRLISEYISKHPDRREPTIVSADDYFQTRDGYKFDPSRLNTAHATCFRNFIRALQGGAENNPFPILVDNTNTTALEISPYVLGAQAYGREAEVHRLECDLAEAVALGRHGVPVAGVEQQHARIQECVMMPWWKFHSIPRDTY